MQARRLWYYSTLLAPYAMGNQGYGAASNGGGEGGGVPSSIPEAGFSPERMAKLQAAAGEAFVDLKKFR